MNSHSYTLEISADPSSKNGFFFNYPAGYPRLVDDDIDQLGKKLEGLTINPTNSLSQYPVFHSSLGKSLQGQSTNHDRETAGVPGGSSTLNHEEKKKSPQRNFGERPGGALSYEEENQGMVIFCNGKHVQQTSPDISKDSERRESQQESNKASHPDYHFVKNIPKVSYKSWKEEFIVSSLMKRKGQTRFQRIWQDRILVLKMRIFSENTEEVGFQI